MGSVEAITEKPLRDNTSAVGIQKINNDIKGYFFPLKCDRCSSASLHHNILDVVGLITTGKFTE